MKSTESLTKKNNRWKSLEILTHGFIYRHFNATLHGGIMLSRDFFCIFYLLNLRWRGI